VMALAVRALELDPGVRHALELADSASKQRRNASELFEKTGSLKFLTNRLLHVILRAAPISSLRFENFITFARRALLAKTINTEHEAADVAALQFFCDLTTQCFITEYIFSMTPEEASQASEMRQALQMGLNEAKTISPFMIVSTAAYFPLHHIPAIEKLLKQTWPTSIADLLRQQVQEPLEEGRLRRSIPKLTSIQDNISLQVHHQYEENPYPRWTKAARSRGKPSQIEKYLRLLYPLASIAPFENQKIDVLVAGCGTGRQSVEIALQFPEARILAVDLSLSALAFAKRQTEQYAIKNIEYAQADIVEIDSIGQSFDVIFASGVLHHLADPFAGWRKLVALLRARGFMNIALYSERAREDIIAAQRFLIDRGYKPTPDDIRKCREEFRRLPDESPLKNVTYLADFYSISELRDLLFHVQEHRMNLHQIAKFLAGTDLQFIGFDIAQYTLQQYRQAFPDDKAATNLAQWDQFEQQHPRAFIGMYQFWVQKSSIH